MYADVARPPTPADYSRSSFISALFSSWYALVDVSAADARRLDPRLHPNQRFYWHQLQMPNVPNPYPAYTALSGAKTALKETLLEVLPAFTMLSCYC